MTKPPASTGFQLSIPDPALVLPTHASAAGAGARQPAAFKAAHAAAGSIGETRPIPSLIALRGLVGLPDPAVMPDYSALQALVDAGAAPQYVEASKAEPSALADPATASAIPTAPGLTSPAPKPRKARRPARPVKVVKPALDAATDVAEAPPVDASASGAATAPPVETSAPFPSRESLDAPPPVEAPVVVASTLTPRDATAADETPTVMDAAGPQAGFLESTGAFLGVSNERFVGLRRAADARTASTPPFAGGLFDTAAGERMVLRKPAPAHDGMNDFIAGMLARLALPDAPWVAPLTFNGDTWLASPHVAGAIDLNEFAQAAGSDGGTAPNGIARRLESHELTRRVVRAFEQCCGKGLEENVAFAMLVGADEQHSGHFVVVLDDDGAGGRRVRRVVRTDCTAASREHQRLHRIRSNYFDHQMHPAPTPRRLPGFGPNQHRVDVPRDLRCNAPYIEALLALSRLDFSQAVSLAFLEAAHRWSDDVCRAFAVNTNLRLPTRRWTSEALFEECGRAYLQRIEARQKSMQRYAADLAIGLATVESQPPSQVLTLDCGPDGGVLLDAFLRQPETRPAIEAWLRTEPGAARQRNLSLDRHEVALRRAVEARLALIAD